MNKSSISFTIGSAFNLLTSNNKRVLTYDDLLAEYEQIKSMGQIEMQLWDIEELVFKEEPIIRK